MIIYINIIYFQAWVSIKRINKFLNLEELDPDSVLHDPNEGNTVYRKLYIFKI